MGVFVFCCVLFSGVGVSMFCLFVWFVGVFVVFEGCFLFVLVGILFYHVCCCALLWVVVVVCCSLFLRAVRFLFAV